MNEGPEAPTDDLSQIHNLVSFDDLGFRHRPWPKKIRVIEDFDLKRRLKNGNFFRLVAFSKTMTFNFDYCDFEQLHRRRRGWRLFHHGYLDQLCMLPLIFSVKPILANLKRSNSTLFDNFGAFEF